MENSVLIRLFTKVEIPPTRETVSELITPELKQRLDGQHSIQNRERNDQMLPLNQRWSFLIRISSACMFGVSA